jgi:hypothetical protein
LSNGLKNEYFALQTFPSKFQDLKFFVWFSFHQVHSMFCTFIEGGMFLLYKKFEINCMTLNIPFDSLKQKCNLETWYIYFTWFEMTFT